MASSSSIGVSLLLFSILSVSATMATARPGIHFHPCKTLFISYTISSFRPPNTNPSSHALPLALPSSFFAIYREFDTGFDPKPFHSQFFLDRRPELPYATRHPELAQPHLHALSFGLSSLRDRTKDILGVVLALLFGVGCGALTSATIYLVCSVITSRRAIDDALHGDDTDADSDDDRCPLKDDGYVKIPASPVKEGRQGN